MTNEGRYTLDAEPVDVETFRRAVIDPAASVVVDACAGSGKTTLLVTRIIRAFLAGVEPDQVLAVTFTRLAAHEMKERLMASLQQLALCEYAALLHQLTGRYGLSESAACAVADRARGLYETVLGHPRGPEITTFHRWFNRLVTLAPLSAGNQTGATLTEAGEAWVQRAWFVWLDQLTDPRMASLRTDFEGLVARFGLHIVRESLLSMLAQRTSWAVAAGIDLDTDAAGLTKAAERTAQPVREAFQDLVSREWGLQDPDADFSSRLLGWIKDPHTGESLAGFAEVLGQGTDTQRQRALTLDRLLQQQPGDSVSAVAWIHALADVMLFKGSGRPQPWPTSKSIKGACQGAGGHAVWAERWADLGNRVARLRALADEGLDVECNARALRCGAALIDTHRQLKRQNGVMDFADLEATAWRLLRDPQTAAYVQCRLDSRYRQLLFDEFQDTSSLQWRLIADWLQSYAGAGERPVVFVVGDPKQSIYRFRQAEARVFDAAKVLLREAFDAREAATDTTHRNAPALVDALNRCLPAVMPHYRIQATVSTFGAGFFWRLPQAVVAKEKSALAETETDWLKDERARSEPTHYQEGLAIADALLAAREHLRAHGHSLAWSRVMILARGRSGFTAYEQALRDRGLPVWSDRSGGLLGTLEAEDLRALLAFARRTDDDLALTQVLASPLVGMSLAEIDALVIEAGGAGLWRALRRRQSGSDQTTHGAAVVDRLTAWIDRAAREPVHDFLDAVLAQTQAFERYPASVEPSRRQGVSANLETMLGLALDFDAGRFPSLFRFLEHVRSFEALEDREGPSEGRADGIDSIRMMTIHSAKGLEADVVVLAAAQSPGKPEGPGLHVDWPPEVLRPGRVAFRFGASHLALTQQASNERETALKEREDRNLLYVALTRARLGVIVSASPSKKSNETSWYACLEGVNPPPTGQAAVDVVQCESEPCGSFEWPVLELPSLQIGSRRADTLEGSSSEPSDGSLGTELGLALHCALEWLSRGADGPTLRAALARFSLTGVQQRRAIELAGVVRSLPDLLPAFDPRYPAADEFEILDADGSLSRLDRIAQVGGVLWIIDYKWSVDARNREAYRDQLARYRRLITALDPPPFGKWITVRTALVDASAAAVQWDVDL